MNKIKLSCGRDLAELLELLTFKTKVATWIQPYSIYRHGGICGMADEAVLNKVLASKIKLKNVNKKRMATARRQIFFGISRGIHC